MPGAHLTASVNAKAGLGLVSRSLGPLIGPRAGSRTSGERRAVVTWAAPPPSLTRIGKPNSFATPVHRTVGGDTMISRSQSIVSRALCTGHQEDDSTSKRVWRGPTGWHLRPAIQSEYATDCRRRQDLESRPKRQSARRIRLSLDTRGPHTGSAEARKLTLRIKPDWYHNAGWLTRTRCPAICGCASKAAWIR
jgi:hypothetical protein